MSDRQFPDLLNAMEWNLVAREAIQVSPKRYLPTRTFLIQNSSVVMVGVNSQKALNTWHTGCWASQLIPFSPGSNSTFVAAVQAERRKVRLRQLNLLVFPKLSSTWILEIAFPNWLYEVSLEIWRYDGQDVSEFDYLAQLGQQLDRIEARLQAP